MLQVLLEHLGRHQGRLHSTRTQTTPIMMRFHWRSVCEHYASQNRFSITWTSCSASKEDLWLSIPTKSEKVTARPDNVVAGLDSIKDHRASDFDWLVGRILRGWLMLLLLSFVLLNSGFLGFVEGLYVLNDHSLPPTSLNFAAGLCSLERHQSQDTIPCNCWLSCTILIWFCWSRSTNSLTALCIAAMWMNT